jgi:hypothetical protein
MLSENEAERTERALVALPFRVNAIASVGPYRHSSVTDRGDTARLASSIESMTS